jgi:hypothetical protein
MKSKRCRETPNKRIGRKAIASYTRLLLSRIEQYHKRPTKTAQQRYLAAVQSLAALAVLFEDAAARNYRVIRLGLKTNQSAIFAQRVR